MAAPRYQNTSLVLLIATLLLTACVAEAQPPTSTTSPIDPAHVLATARQEALVTMQAYRTQQAVAPSPTAPSAGTVATPQPGDLLPLPSAGGPAPDMALARLGIGIIYNAVISPDSEYLAVGTSVGVFLYDLDTLDLLWSKPMEGTVGRISWMPYGDILIAIPGGGTDLTGWEVPSGEQAFLFEHSQAITGFAWAPDATKIAVAWGGPSSALLPSETDIPPRLTVWDLETLEQRYTVTVPVSQEDTYEGASGLTDLIWSPDVGLIAGVASAHVDNSRPDPVPTGMVWDSKTGRLMYFLPQPAINFLAFSADTGSIATWTGSGTGTTPGSHDVWLWDALDGELNHRLAGHTGYVWNVRWHPDGSSLLSASDDGTIIQWNPETGEVIEEFRGPPIFPGSLFWSSNTRYFVSAGYSNKERRARLIVWDPATVAPRYTVDSPTQEWQFVASGASNGRWLVAFSPERLSLIEAETGKITASLVGAPLDIEAWLLAWSADSSTLTTTYARMDSQTTSTWDIADLQPIDTRQLARVFQPFPEIHVSPNGQYDLQVTSEQAGEWWEQSYRSTISVIRLSDHVRVARMAGPHASVTRVAWSPDNTHFAVAGGLDAEFLGDTVVKGWDENAVLICNRETISCRVLPGHTGQVLALSFSPDGQLLATASADGTVVIWQVSP